MAQHKQLVAAGGLQMLAMSMSGVGMQHSIQSCSMVPFAADIGGLLHAS